MRTVTTKPELLQPPADNSSCLLDDWFDPIEAGLRERVRELIEEMIRGELDAVLSRPRYGRRRKSVEGEEIAGVAGHRHLAIDRPHPRDNVPLLHNGISHFGPLAIAGGSFRQERKRWLS